MKFTYTVNHAGPDTEYIFSGDLDEEAVLPPFEGQAAGVVRINLGNLISINSLGCRNWINWIRNVKAEKGVFLVHCSPAAVYQVGILVGFVPDNVVVDSFYVPFYCKSCNEEKLRLLVRGKDFDFDGRVEPGEETCPKCGTKMALDLIPARYFRFLQPSNK